MRSSLGPSGAVWSVGTALRVGVACLATSCTVTEVPPAAPVRVEREVIVQRVVAAPDPAPPPDVEVEPSPFVAGDSWSGSYACGRDATRLVLRITRGAPEVDAVFNFATSRGASGSFVVHGAYDASARRLQLAPGPWIRRPFGFVTVGMDGAVGADGLTYSGRIVAAGCGGFDMSRAGTATVLARQPGAVAAPLSPVPFSAPVEAAGANLPPVTRHVPNHPLHILDGCSDADKAMISQTLGIAIDVGAPQYNAGRLSDCYNTYRAAAEDLERRLPPACAGPIAALKAGRDTAGGLIHARDQAWAMRDAFDGLVGVIAKEHQEAEWARMRAAQANAAAEQARAQQVRQRADDAAHADAVAAQARQRAMAACRSQCQSACTGDDACQKACVAQKCH